MIFLPGIEYAEWDKKILRMGLRLICKKLVKKEAVRNDDLKCSPVPIVKALDKLIEVTADNLKPKWQRDSTRTFGKFFLWLVVKDTAYRDAFFWVLYKILKMADKLLPLIEPYVKPPEEWFPNVWQDGIDATAKGKADGTIPKNGLSQVESMFIPKKHTR